MSLESIDKIKITSFIRKHSIDDIYISDFFEGKNPKYTEMDILNYLVDFINSHIDEKCKENITYNYLSKLITVIHTIVFELIETVEFPDNLLDKIMLLKNNYLKYFQNKELPKDCPKEYLDNLIEEIIKALESIKKEPSEESISSEEIEGLQQKINELTIVIDAKNEEINELKELLRKSNKDNSKNSKLLSKKIAEIEKTKKSLKDLQDMVDSLNKEIQNIQDKCDTLKKRNETIPTLQAEIEHLKQNIKTLKDNIASYEFKEKEAAKETVEKEKQQKTLHHLDNVIFSILCENSLTIDELSEELNNRSMFRSKEEILASLKRVQNRVNIMSKVRQIPQKYGICSPSTDINLQACINVPNNSYNILLVSDMHLESIDSDSLYWLNELYEYAALNNIDLIANLGDFIDIKPIKNNSVEVVKKAEKLLEAIALKFPKDKNISHLLLGGNHDKRLLPYGIDPIKQICSMRDDFIDLGYDHGSIYLNKSLLTKEDKPRNYIFIHHPNFRADPNLLDNDNISKVNTYLTSIYETYDLNRNNSYVDVLGHFHKSSLDIASGVCVLPSYFDDRVCNGAWHLKIFFDKENNIDHIVFVPLICQNKLIATSEISYKKVLKQS